MTKNLRRIFPALLVASLSLSAHARQTAAVQPRIGVIDNGNRVTLPNSHTTRIDGATDLGVVAPDKLLTGITMVFSRSAAQEQALQALLAAQLNPSSPQFHQWLTPAQFGAQFGLADADLAAAQTWLQQQGFTNITISASRDRISFDGTASQVATAFGAGLHNYQAADGTQHIAPSHDLTLPAALAANVVTVANLSSFRAKPHVRRLPESPAGATSTASPRFTSSVSGSHFVTPLDLGTIYDINRAYTAGYTGAGQSIAVVGQSFIYAADIADFQNALGLPVKPPTMVLVPNSGVPVEENDGDEAESDLDVEYSGSIAPGANIYFVYTGSTTTTGAFGAAVYAIDEDIAPVITISYGECEVTAQSDSAAVTLNSALPQAAAQGQTVIAAAGDDGSTDCYGETTLTAAQRESVSVDFPGSSQYVLSAGGSEFPAADVAVGNTTYWSPQGSTDTVSSALSYIPEQVWNDDVAAGSPNAGGGGTSTTVLRPSWQSSAVPGIATIGGSYRLVPDLALDASDADAPLAICTSDDTFYSNGQDFSCNSGLRDSVTGDLTVGGGTSFVAPTLAGLVAILNQARSYTGGQGTIAPTFYSLASNPITYASAFHDITSGGNQCLAAGICVAPATTEYAAATGYDEASGLGSLDFYNLLTAWPTNAVATGLSTPTITIAPATTTPALGAADNLTVTLTGSAGTVGGTVNINVDGNTVASPTLSGGTTTYAFSTATAGQHVVTAVYTGSGTYSTATASTVLQAGGSFTVSAPSISVAAGSSITTTFTAMPVNGYTGTVAYILTGNNSGLLNACFSPTLPTSTVNGVSASSVTVTIYTSTTSCTSAGATATLGGLARKGSTTSISANTSGPLSRNPFHAPLAIAAAGLLAVFGLRRKGPRMLRVSASLGLLMVLALAGISGCSSGGTAVAPTTGTTTTPAGSATPGTYLITVSAYDYSGNPNAPFSSNLNATTTFTITVH